MLYCDMVFGLRPCDTPNKASVSHSVFSLLYSIVYKYKYI